ncbi:hypothetical protein D3C78_1778140 [compost metagenome]
MLLSSAIVLSFLISGNGVLKNRKATKTTVNPIIRYTHCTASKWLLVSATVLSKNSLAPIIGPTKAPMPLKLWARFKRNADVSFFPNMVT